MGENISSTTFSTPPDVLAPAALGPITLRNRIIKSATFEGKTPNALVTEDLIEFHRRPAAGGVGMCTVAYCAVAPEGRTEYGQLWMRPDALPGLRRLTDAIHAEGAAASAQLGHAGPVANEKSTGCPALAPSRWINPLSMRMIRAATSADIARIIRAHATAAQLAVEAGFDAVELHFGHNYFASSFLSPKLNRRNDSYGASLENRARVVLETARAVRDAVGGKVHARQFRAAVKLPLVLLGGVTDRADMDAAMAEGFEFVAMARALLREPDLVNRIAADPEKKSLCIHCNKCMPTIFSGSRCVLVERAPDRPKP